MMKNQTVILMKPYKNNNVWEHRWYELQLTILGSVSFKSAPT